MPDGVTMKIKLICLGLAILIVTALAGCSSRTTIYVPYTPTTTIIQTIITTTTTRTPTTTIPTTTKPTTTRFNRSWAWVPDDDSRILPDGKYAYIPSGYIEAGRTVSLTWSADQKMEVYIFTENQFNNFRQNFNIASAWIAHGSGNDGTIKGYVQNSDKYYAVLKYIYGFGSSVKLYSALLAEE